MLWFLSLSCACVAADIPEYPFSPTQLGLLHVHLEYFVPSDLSPIVERLKVGRLEEARVGLEEQAHARPNDLFVYALWMQADPRKWAPELDRLRHLPHTDNADTLRLAVLHFYHWACYKLPHRQPRPGVSIFEAAQDWTELDLARRQAGIAWREGHHPLAALLIYTTGLFGHKGMDFRLNQQEILLKPAAAFAGTRAWADYENAGEKGWLGVPPTQLVPVGNRRALSGMLELLWAAANSQRRADQAFIGRETGGRKADREPAPHPSAGSTVGSGRRLQLDAQMAYLDRWIKSLRAAAPVTPPH